MTTNSFNFLSLFSQIRLEKTNACLTFFKVLLTHFNLRLEKKIDEIIFFLIKKLTREQGRI